MKDDFSEGEYNDDCLDMLKQPTPVFMPNAMLSTIAQKSEIDDGFEF